MDGRDMVFDLCMRAPAITERCVRLERAPQDRHI
jgi:hypothetical protein